MNTTNSTVSSIIIIFDGIDSLGAVIINKKDIIWVRNIHTNTIILTIRC